MQPRQLLDQRQHPRRDASLVVSYRPMEPTAGYDITQTRNISQGGMLLTTARAFAAGDQLAIQARLPFGDSPRIVETIAKAIESREIVPGLLYETRVQFVDLDTSSFRPIEAFCAGGADAVSAGGDERQDSLRLIA